MYTIKKNKIKWKTDNKLHLNIQELDTEQGKIIFDNVKLGEGSFSTVIPCKLRINDSDKIIDCAAKIEKKDKNNLLYEYKIYKVIGKLRGLPNIIGFVNTGQNNILLMEKMDSCLMKMINKYKKFKIKIVLKIFIQALHILKKIHKRCVIHRDIKPSNFMLKDKELKLIDFGLAKIHADEERIIGNGRIIGTLRYCSINAHESCELSYKDDLESLGFTMVYFMKGQLPWQHVRYETVKQMNSKISQIKMSLTSEELCKGLPIIFTYYFNKVRNLNFDETIHYNKMITKIKNYLNHLEYVKKNKKHSSIINYNKTILY
jgi:serine/threonine protein kinase